MITQIYSLSDPALAVEVAKAGADYIGVNPTAKNNGKTKEKAMADSIAVFNAIDGLATKVALSIDCTFEEQVEIIEKVKPDILHICGNDDDATPELVKKLKEVDPKLRIEQAVAMSGPRLSRKPFTSASFATC